MGLCRERGHWSVMETGRLGGTEQWLWRSGPWSACTRITKDAFAKQPPKSRPSPTKTAPGPRPGSLDPRQPAPPAACTPGSLHPGRPAPLCWRGAALPLVLMLPRWLGSQARPRLPWLDVFIDPTIPFLPGDGLVFPARCPLRSYWEAQTLSSPAPQAHSSPHSPHCL